MFYRHTTSHCPSRSTVCCHLPAHLILTLNSSSKFSFFAPGTAAPLTCRKAMSTRSKKTSKSTQNINSRCGWLGASRTTLSPRGSGASFRVDDPWSKEKCLRYALATTQQKRGYCLTGTHYQKLLLYWHAIPQQVLEMAAAVLVRNTQAQ